MLETDEHYAYWSPSGEKSGIYGGEAAVTAALLARLPGAERIDGGQQVSISLDIGYWPDP
ncbi:hypothetical protein [Sphingomonas colocasiae]|uniref:Uncharacterized protein n=1 Tax=Sphingomonas colocasiae TaxID=1848973 RepID=A0ABS7PUQ6_9SPHN|nr:hypothetical protein [Sphingomonas colocasiae]MBY8825086.1 hypothetical protein [Sphingomonas colocasiae]